MNYRQSLLAVSLVLGLAGCASYSSGYPSGVVYRDGNYYSPADEGYGDYYYAPEPRDDYYDYYGQDFFYGGGYCSVRYSYCPPFWNSQFLAPPFGYMPWGGGFGYGYYYPSPYSYGGHRRRGHDRDHDGDRDHHGEPGAGVLPAMPAPTERAQRLRYPAPAPGRVRPEPRRMVAEPDRAYPAGAAPRSSPSSDSASGDGDRRSERRRRRGE